MEWKELRKKTVLVGLTLNQYIGGGGRGGWVLPKRVDSVFVFKRELGEKEEVVFLREGYPNAHYR